MEVLSVNPLIEIFDNLTHRRCKEVYTMFSYPARLTKVGAGYVVSFRDIPEALTEGSSKEEALDMAGDALTSAMEFYFEDRREVPMPSKAKKGEEAVALSTSMAAKVLLLNEMLRAKVTPTALAKRLQTSPQVVTRIVDLHHSTKIDTIAEAFSAMGKTLVLSVA
ncbi:type II toxin-antitoxin system HicB family antitoxin [Xanthomonas arboricola]|uniref:type II toxin-antitoxin system HicB family antitoxin n=1 Tax=Xanthomonas arboricola TaxID=56448 RepID=UPI003EB8EE91